MARTKRLRAIATFSSTHDAIEAEALCQDACVPGRLIPTPVSIRATCGLSWSMDPDDRFAFADAIRGRLVVEGIQEIMI